MLLSDDTSFSFSKSSSGDAYTVPFALNSLSLAKSYSSCKLRLRTQLFWEAFLQFPLYFPLLIAPCISPAWKHLPCSIIVIAVSLPICPPAIWASWGLLPCLFGSVLHLVPSTGPAMRVTYMLKINTDANWNWGSEDYLQRRICKWSEKTRLLRAETWNIPRDSDRLHGGPPGRRQWHHHAKRVKKEEPGWGTRGHYCRGEVITDGVGFQSKWVWIRVTNYPDFNTQTPVSLEDPSSRQT